MKHAAAMQLIAFLSLVGALVFGDVRALIFTIPLSMSLVGAAGLAHMLFFAPKR